MSQYCLLWHRSNVSVLLALYRPTIYHYIVIHRPAGFEQNILSHYRVTCTLSWYCLKIQNDWSPMHPYHFPCPLWTFTMLSEPPLKRNPVFQNKGCLSYYFLTLTTDWIHWLGVIKLHTLALLGRLGLSLAKLPASEKLSGMSGVTLRDRKPLDPIYIRLACNEIVNNNLSVLQILSKDQ